ncbi:MAG TPA: FAD-dependent oxidoreductase [Candidatus Nanopelagicaceae bacterium]
MSLWWTRVEHPQFSPEQLDRNWDVVIVGGGFSGLWCAHHLITSNPALSIAVLEQSQVGSGASGRNGGWVSALYPAGDKSLLENFSQRKIDSLHSHLRNAIDQIGTFVTEEKIDCGFHKGGTLVVARNQGQLKRLRAEVEGDSTWLSADETRERIGMTHALGALYTPDCAAIDPAALVVGLALSLEKRGVSIFENTYAEISRAKKVYVGGRKIRARSVVRAIEAYHANSRNQIPIYSLMIATEPLPAEVFNAIGLHNRETFADGSHLVNYAQRTADNRLAIGGRGAPYTWGSRRNDALENAEAIHRHLRKMAQEWFPILEKYEFTHSWGGAVGITRDWNPYVRWRGSFGEMGGYAGDGVTLSYLAAATMSDLILQRVTSRTELPFAQWKNPRWEFEPLRWLAVNAVIKLSSLADWEEKMTRRPSLIMKTLAPIIGK